MAETQPPMSASAATSSRAPAVDEKAFLHSPAASDKTVVPSAAPGSFAAPKAQDVDRLPVALSGDALFSTDLGRRRHIYTPGPPFPPVIVRSDKMQGVADVAKYWFGKYPSQYLCIFPGCGYSIYDLWDSADIHINSPSFLAEVLKFITYDNVHRARDFAVHWSQKHRDRLDIIGGDLTGIYDPNDHLAIVDKIFVDGETERYPRAFLWHAAHVMRTGMLNITMKSQPAASASNVQGVAKADGNDTGETDITSASAAERRPTVAAEEGQPEPEATPSSGSREANRRKFVGRVRKKNLTTLPEVLPVPELPVVAPNAVYPPSIVPPAQVNHQTQSPSFVPMQPPRKGYQSQPPGFVPGFDSRNFKSRSFRQNSGSYNQPMSYHNWAENLPMHPSGHQSRQPSGTMSAMQPPQYPASVPMGQLMMNPVNPMLPYPQNAGMMSPPMAPGQMPYGAMMHPGMMPPPTAPYGAPPLDFAQQNYPPGFPPSSGPRGMPIGDMANNPQFPYNAQHNEQRAGMHRRGSQTNKTGLYNPYGAERPDFAMIPAQPVSRKPPRNSFSNPAGRGRKFSVGARSGYSQYNFDRGDYSAPYTGGRYPEASNTRNFSNNSHGTFVNGNDPTIIADKERGCSESWIGPKNDYVNYLWVCELPSDTTSEELQAMFEDTVKVKVDYVRLVTDKRQQPIAYVHFFTPADARKGLELRNPSLRGKKLLVRVPKHFYMLPDPNRHPRGQSALNYYTKTGYVPPQSRPVTYSPQDARSSLPRDALRPQEPEHPAVRGSPEARKPKQQQESPTKKAKSEHESLREHNDTSSAASEPTQEKKEEYQASTVVEETSAMKESRPIEQEANVTAISVEDPAAIAVEKDSSVLAKSDTSGHDTKTTPNETIQPGRAPPLPLQQTVPKAEKTVEASVPKSTAPAPTEPSRSPSPLPSYKVVQYSQEQPFQKQATQEESVQEQHIRNQPVQEQAAQEESVQEQPILDQPFQEQNLQEQPTQQHQTLEGEIIQETTFDEADPGLEELAESQSATRDQPSKSLSDSHVRDEVASDEEDKNDVSYHSAKETQLDLLKPEAKDDFEKMAGPHAQEVMPSISTATEKEKAEIQTKELVTVPAKASAVIEKKPGAKQTESIHPFAKTKAQIKEEKKAKKKEKKKAKAEKGRPSGTPAQAISGKAKTESSQNEQVSPRLRMQSSTRADFISSSVTNPDSQNDKQNADIDEADPGARGKDSIPLQETPDTQDLRAYPGSSAQTPKQGTTPYAQSHEHISVPATAAKATEIPDPALAPGQLPMKTKETQGQVKKSKVVQEKIAVPNLNLLKRNSPPSSNTSSAKPGPSGVPSPADSSRYPDGVEQTSQEMQDKVDKGDRQHQIEKVANVDESASKVEGEPNAEKRRQTASVASSGTVRGSPPTSPSPTPVEFHTPSQTRTGSAPPQSEAPKKKSKKKKKKAPAAAAPATPIEETSVSVPDADGEAFKDQLDFIDKLEYLDKLDYVNVLVQTGGGESGYYASRDAEASFDAGNSTQETSGSSKKKPETSLIQEIGHYVREKSAYSDLSQNDYRPNQPPKKLTNELIEDIINGPKISLGMQLLLDDDGSVPKAGTKPFFT